MLRYFDAFDFLEDEEVAFLENVIIFWFKQTKDALACLRRKVLVSILSPSVQFPV